MAIGLSYSLRAPGRWTAWPARLRTEYVLSLSFVFCALLVFASYSLVALAHLDDRHQITYVESIFLTLAWETSQGRLYPDLQSDEIYGGTRYMPLPFLLMAGVSSLIGGNFLLGGKLLALVLMGLLCLQVLLITRWRGCRWSVALALAALLPASSTGFFAGTTIRGDLLPVVIQVAALALVARGATPARLALAGLLCALALLAKMSALWAPAAIALHLLVSDRRRLPLFLASALASFTLFMGILHLASQGHMIENFTLPGGGFPLSNLMKSPFRLLAFLGKQGSVTHILTPLAGLACLLAYRLGRWTIWHSSLLLAVPTTLLIYADPGTVSNHLIDLVALMVIVLATLWPLTETAGDEADLAEPPAAMDFLTGPSLLGKVLTVVLCWTLVSCWVLNAVRPLREVVDGWRSGRATAAPAIPLIGLVGTEERILSEDAWVPVSRGQRPVLLDPYSLGRQASADPHCTAQLVARLGRQEFDKVILVQRPGGDTDTSDETEICNMGRPVAEAIRRFYQPLLYAEGYCICIPKSQ